MMSKEFIAGRNPVLEALRSDREINKIWIAEGAQKGPVQQIIKKAKEKMYSFNLSLNKKLIR